MPLRRGALPPPGHEERLALERHADPLPGYRRLPPAPEGGLSGLRRAALPFLEPGSIPPSPGGEPGRRAATGGRSAPHRGRPGAVARRIHAPGGGRGKPAGQLYRKIRPEALGAAASVEAGQHGGAGGAGARAGPLRGTHRRTEAPPEALTGPEGPADGCLWLPGGHRRGGPTASEDERAE